MSERFEIRENDKGAVPLLIGIMGMPGAGKTFSALELATGMRTPSTERPIVIDTELGRSQKYRDHFDFGRIDLAAPFKPSRFLAAIRAAQAANPCAIVLDSASDEHEGEGGVLDWRDSEIAKMGGNEWAAWRSPKNDRRLLVNGMLQILTPLILCFRAREKTKQLRDDRGKMVPQNIGYQPIAPAEIIGQLDLNVLLPPKSNGCPTWRSGKGAEDFVIKLPEHFKPLFGTGQPLSRDHGAALAAWARGEGPIVKRVDPGAVLRTARDACRDGRVAWGYWKANASAQERAAIKPHLDELKAILEAGDIEDEIDDRGDQDSQVEAAE